MTPRLTITDNRYSASSDPLVIGNGPEPPLDYLWKTPLIRRSARE